MLRRTRSIDKMKFTNASLQRFYLFFITIIFILVAGICIYGINADYDLLINSIVKNTGKNGLENKIRNQVFTHARFQMLQQTLYAVILFSAIFYWLAFRFRIYIINAFVFFITSLLQAFNSVRNVFRYNLPSHNRQFIVLLSVIAASFIYGMFTLYLSYDEMWSYNYYTAGHFYYSFFAYSNYPFFEMTTHFFKWFPFSMQINLRLSSFCFGISSCVLLYACVRKYFNNHFTAMAGLIAFAFLPVTVSYSILARGVIHELFFAIAGIFSLLFWIKENGQKRFLAVYAIAAILGCYAIPTHCILIFFLLLTGMWFFRKNWEMITAFFKTHLLILMAVLLVYLPVMLTTGFAIFRNIFSARSSYYNSIVSLPGYVITLYSYFAWFNRVALFICILLLIGLLIFRKQMNNISRTVLFIALGLPVVLIFLVLVTGIKYPGRSIPFGALSIVLVICLAAHLTEIYFNVKAVVKKSIGVVAVILLLLFNKYEIVSVVPYDKNVAEVSKLLLESNIRSCYDNSGSETKFYYYYPGIEYYYRVEKKSIEFTVASTNSMRYKPLSNENYDCIIYKTDASDSTRLATYHELYREPFGRFKIWVRNDVIKKP